MDVASLIFRSMFALLIFTTASIGHTGTSQSEAEVRNGLRACLQIPNALRRLDCFDKLARNNVNGENLDVPGAGALPAPRSTYDRPHRPSSASDNQAIRSSLLRIEERPRGERVFYLESGEVWTEIEPGRARYEAGAEVHINRTLFGSYMLSVEGVRATRVRRLQ